ncbi:MAG: nuclear transport factor 2 family protein [Phycisphaerae bacterium]|nr:nuclear transport factor 2 family protein [Phycisphaerae bacterium]MDZ4781024.1 nuclear transport factor 2 family protein [Planctomycetia bacterium]
MNTRTVAKTASALKNGEAPDAWTQTLFGSLDVMDVEKFISFMTDDVRFQFAGQPEVNGRKATFEYLKGFLGMLDAIVHDLKWQVRNGDTLIVHGLAEYRAGAGRASVSWINVLTLRGGKIADYLIFVDSVPLAGLLASHTKSS